MTQSDPTLSYALRELADWLEHRTGGDEPRDESRILLARSMIGRAEQIERALEQSVKLQAHYAKLLNMHDGGEHLVFESVDAWLERLNVIPPGSNLVDSGGGAEHMVVRPVLAEPQPDAVEQKPCPQIVFSTDTTTMLIHAKCGNSLHDYQLDPRETPGRDAMMRKLVEDLSRLHGWKPRGMAEALSSIPNMGGTYSFKIRHPTAREAPR